MSGLEQKQKDEPPPADPQWIPVESISYLIHSVRPKTDFSDPGPTPPNTQEDPSTEPPRLGDFDAVWHFLGVPKERIPTNIEILDESEPADRTKDDNPSKGVKWRDEVKTGDKLEEYTTRKYLMTLTKSQKKLARRENAKAARLRRLSEGDSSESESAKQRSNLIRRHKSSRSTSQLAVVSDASSDSERQPLSPQTRKSVIDDYLGKNKFKKPKTEDSVSTKPAPTVNTGLEVSITGRIQILPLLEPAERAAQLATKLFEKFPQDRTTLAKLTRPTFLPNVGIYVFVDFSNILIGFYERLKKLRGIDSEQPHVRRTPFSYKNFVRFVERGRSCSRRVIVGSLPETSATTEAKELGYDVNLLERVHKMRDVSTRRNSHGSGKGSGYSGMSSGSETTARFKMRLVEQAVDELLQMKMLETLVDTATPTTAVLATGDGAVAEYSDGFFKVVERFLERNWTVELVSFRKQTNWCYRDPAFKAKWGTKFKHLLLDDYCEYLFGDLA